MDDEELYIGQEDVLKLLNGFVDEKENRRIADAASGLGRQKSTRGKGNFEEKIQIEQRKFWLKLSNSINSSTRKDLEITVKKLNEKFTSLNRLNQVISRRDIARDENEQIRKIFKKYIEDKDHLLISSPYSQIDQEVFRILSL